MSSTVTDAKQNENRAEKTGLLDRILDKVTDTTQNMVQNIPQIDLTKNWDRISDASQQVVKELQKVEISDVLTNAFPKISNKEQFFHLIDEIEDKDTLAKIIASDGGIGPLQELVQEISHLKQIKSLIKKDADRAEIKEILARARDRSKLQELLNQEDKSRYAIAIKKLITLGKAQIQFPSMIQPLKQENIFLGNLISKGLLGLLLPLIIAVVFGIFGFLGEQPTYIWGSASIREIFFNTTQQRLYTYWIGFVTIGAYLLTLYGAAVNRVMQIAHKTLTFPQKTSVRWQRGILGWFGEIMVIVLSLPFIYFDLRSFEATTGIDLAADKFETYSWSAILTLNWIYFAAFLWLSIGLLVFIARNLPRTTWRRGINTIIETKEFRRLLNLLIFVYIPLLPYIFLKLVFQLILQEVGLTLADSIGSFSLLGIFLIGVITGPSLLSSDIKKETRGILEPQKKAGVAFVQDTFKKIMNKEEISQNDVMKALLVQMNTNNVVNQLKEKILDSSIVKKIIVIISGPVVAYIGQLIQGIGFLSDLFAQLGFSVP